MFEWSAKEHKVQYSCTAYIGQRLMWDWALELRSFFGEKMYGFSVWVIT